MSETTSPAEQSSQANSSKPTSISDLERERQEWARRLRLKLSPRDMIKEDGSLNEDYFKPKRVAISSRKWGEKERELLIKGIEKFGIGEWAEISKHFLPEWEVTELRLKTQKLMGRQSLVEYINQRWKGSAEDIERERLRNKEIGELTGMWKGGLLVNDDQGVVKKLLQTHPYPDIKGGKSNRPKLTDEELKRANSIVGKRVQVWFDDEGRYCGGLVTKYDETSRQYTVQWDTGESTEIELDWKDKTFEIANDNRWCLESELDEIERGDSHCNHSSPGVQFSDGMQTVGTISTVTAGDTPQHTDKKQKLDDGSIAGVATSNVQSEETTRKRSEPIEIKDDNDDVIMSKAP
jgi:hypothetical protein